MKTQGLKLSVSESGSDRKPLWQEVSEKSQAEISGGCDLPDPSCASGELYRDLTLEIPYENLRGTR